MSSNQKNTLSAADRLQQVIQCLQEGVVACDTELEILVWNSHMERLTGKTAVQVLGRTIEDVFPALKKEGVVGDMQQIIRDGSRKNMVFMLENAAGEIFRVTAAASPLTNQSNEITGIVLAVRETDWAGEGERFLVVNRAHYETAQAIANLGSWELDLRTQYSIWSREMFRLFGLDEHESSPGLETFLTFIHPEDRQCIQEYHVRLLKTGESFNAEYRTSPDRGPVRYMRVKGSPVLDDEGEVCKITGTTQDITEQKRIEEKILNLSRFPEENPNPVFRLDKGGQLLYHNKASRMLVKMWRDETGDRLGGDIVQWANNALSEKTPVKPEVEVDGNIYSLSIMPVPDSGYVNVYGADITDTKLAEDRARKNEAQLRIASQIARLGYWEFNVDEGLFTFNDEFYSVFRTTVKQVGSYKVTPERYAREFLHPDDQYIIPEEMKNALAAPTSDYSRKLEHRIRYGDGEIGYIAVQFFIVKDEAGRTVKTYGANQDITDRKKAELAIRESQRKLISAQFLAGIGDFSLDVTTGKLSWSEGMSELLGYDNSLYNTLDLAIGRIVHPDDGARIQNWLEDALSSGKEGLPPNECRLLRGDGKIITVHIEGYISYQGGKPVTVFGMIQDISKRLEAEQALRDNEQKLATLMANLSGMVYQCLDDESWTMLFVNEACSQLTGYTSEQLVGNREVSYEQLVHPGDRESVRRGVKNTATGDPHYEMEYRIVTADGNIKWVWERGLKTGEMNGVALLEGVIHDISGRKEAEKALQESERKYRTLLNNIVDSVFLHPLMEHEFSNFVEVNKIACKLYGYTAEEFKTMTVRDIVTDDDVTVHSTSDLQNILLKKGKHTFETIHVAKNGERFHVEISANVITIENRKYILSLVRDITERKQAEEERESLHVQLAHAQKMESIGRLAGGIAHDFNNMLGVILGNTEFAMQQVESGSQVYQDLNEIKAAANKSADLTRQLLAFARKQIVMPKQVDLNSVVSSMLDMLKRIIGEDIELIWTKGASLWPIRIDPGQIDQILVNMCINSKDAILRNGFVKIETANITLEEGFAEKRVEIPPGLYVRLTVTDNGCGIEDTVCEHVFEPFFTTKQFGQGTGLGLSTVYGIVKQNNGYIGVTSKRGEGATFNIYFPRHGENKDIRDQGDSADGTAVS